MPGFPEIVTVKSTLSPGVAVADDMVIAGLAANAVVAKNGTDVIINAVLKISANIFLLIWISPLRAFHNFFTIYFSVKSAKMQPLFYINQAPFAKKVFFL